ncbi:MAG: ribulose-phosphate 3-epimerase [Clostridiales bacterium]|nr:ribulose-phosphate 3-epimerase [Clostridiales bacterium]
MIKVAASVLAADLLNLRAEVERVADAGADWLHFDVMDGSFVPNISFGQGLLRAVSSIGRLPCDVHLMIEKPERYVESFAEAGARIITVHAEATTHLQRTLRLIRDCGCLAGASLNPATPPDCLRYVLDDLDLVLVMTVNPGFGGQKLIPAAAAKVGDVRKMLDAANSPAELEADGGIGAANAAEIVRLGATVLVTGSALYGAPDAAAFAAAIHDIKI